MTNSDSKTKEMSLPIIGMFVVGIAGAIVVALSCEVIKFWPQPASVAPYFGWQTGLWWGLIVGALVGLVIGFIADENNYNNQ